MRGPLPLESVRLVRRRTRHSFSDCFQLRRNRLNILVLAKYRVAEFNQRALEVGDFRLDPLQGVILRRAQCLAP